jgi:outer membrane protein assembly factor BamB
VYFAFDRSTGRVLWKYDTRQDGAPAQFHGDPLVTDDLIIAGSDSAAPGYVYAFDRKTGTLHWKTSVGGLETDLLRSGGTAFGVTSEGSLVALELATGKLLWKVDSRKDPSRSRVRAPALSGERIFFPGLDGKVYAVKAATGEILWQRDLGSSITTALLVADGHLFVGALNHHLYRLSPQTGEVTAEHDAGDFPHSVLTLANGSLVALVGEKSLLGLDLGLNARWTRTTSAPWSTLRPLVLGDSVLVGNDAGELLAFRLDDGMPGWSRRIEGVPRGLSRSGSTLFIGTLQGAVLAYEYPQTDRPAPGVRFPERPRRGCEAGTPSSPRRGRHPRSCPPHGLPGRQGGRPRKGGEGPPWRAGLITGSGLP